MKNILSIIMLVLSMSLFSGVANAQEGDTTTVIRTCYNSSLKVVTKNGKNKEKKIKHRENCFELTQTSLTLTDSKGKVTVFNFISINMLINDTGMAYIIEADVDGKLMEILIHTELRYIGIHDPDTGKSFWHFTQL